MGEAKRRSKSDPNYGKVFNLSSSSAKAQHSELVVQELFTTFERDFKILMSATTFPDDFDSICDRLNHWFQLKLLPYQPQDREYIAQFLLSMVTTMGNDFVHDQPFAQQDNISPALLCCILQATKNYLTDSSLNQLRLRFETQLERLNPNEPALHFVEFILKQTQ